MRLHKAKEGAEAEGGSDEFAYFAGRMRARAASALSISFLISAQRLGMPST
jgi:hypothetical protein